MPQGLLDATVKDAS